jgi:hypothetical protein
MSSNGSNVRPSNAFPTRRPGRLDRNGAALYRSAHGPVYYVQLTPGDRQVTP